MTRTDILLDTIAFLRANPGRYNQGLIYRESKGIGCVIGWSAMRAGGAVVKDDYIDTYPGGYRNAREFALKYLNLSEDDYDIIFSTASNLSIIEARVKAIVERERWERDTLNPPVKVKVTFNDNYLMLDEDQIKFAVLVAKATDPDVRIVKITEEVL